MEVKLTLKLGKSVIEKAKQYAKKRKLSLSKLVEEYFTLLIAEEAVENTTVSPAVNELAGILSKKDIVNWKKGYARYLKKKYG
jgi:hypothetical protein